MDGTQNFYSSALEEMIKHQSNMAKVIGRRVPYHLQYVRDGKPNIKPKEDENEKTIRK